MNPSPTNRSHARWPTVDLVAAYEGQLLETLSGIWRVDLVPDREASHLRGGGYRFVCNVVCVVDECAHTACMDVVVTVLDPLEWSPTRILEALAHRCGLGRIKSRLYLFFGHEGNDGRAQYQRASSSSKTQEASDLVHATCPVCTTDMRLNYWTGPLRTQPDQLDVNGVPVSSILVYVFGCANCRNAYYRSGITGTLQSACPEGFIRTVAPRSGTNQTKG